jgi:hypothetical protein
MNAALANQFLLFFTIIFGFFVIAGSFNLFGNRIFEGIESGSNDGSGSKKTDQTNLISSSVF